MSVVVGHRSMYDVNCSSAINYFPLFVDSTNTTDASAINVSLRSVNHEGRIRGDRPPVL